MREAFLRSAVLSILLMTPLRGLAQAAEGAAPVRDWRYVLTIHEIARANDDARLGQLLTDNPDCVLQRLAADGSTAAHAAAEAGALRSLVVLAKAHADLNVTDTRGRTPLSIATGTKFLSTVKTLVALGADPDMEGADNADALGQFTLNSGPELPLCIAARRGYLEVLKALLDGKADANKVGSNGRTPLLSAAAAGKWEVAKVLIESSAKINAADEAGMTALLYAVAASDAKTVEYLLSKGADAKAADKTGRTGLSLTQSGTIWKMLIEKGADVNAVVGGVTPLQYFIDRGYTDLVKTWLEYKPESTDVNKPFANGSTPLVASAATGRWDIAKVLIESSANINAADGAGMTALLYAVAASDAKTVDYLLSKGADAKAADKTGRTGLSLTQSGAIWKMLIEKGADVYVVVGGVTPLQHFIDRGYADLVKTWLEYKPESTDVNKPFANGSTPLVASAATGRWDIAALLIDHRANVNASDSAGMTPLLLAAAASDEKTVAYLLSKGADAKLADRPGRSGLALTRSMPIWKLLVEKGADANAVIGGVTPLQFFIDEGNPENVKAWLTYKPDPMIATRQGATAKELARAAAGRQNTPARQEIARMLEEYQKKYYDEQSRN